MNRFKEDMLKELQEVKLTAEKNRRLPKKHVIKVYEEAVLGNIVLYLQRLRFL